MRCKNCGNATAPLAYTSLFVLARIYYTINEHRRMKWAPSSCRHRRRHRRRTASRIWTVFDCQICNWFWRLVSFLQVLDFNFVAFTYRFWHFFSPLQTHIRMKRKQFWIYILNAIYSHIPFICRCQCLCIVDSLCVLHNEMKYKLNHFLGEMKLFLLVFIIDVQIISVGCFRSPKIRKLNGKRSFIFKIQCKKEIKSTIRIRQVKRWSSCMRVCVSIRLRVLNCRKSVVIYWKRKKFI